MARDGQRRLLKLWQRLLHRRHLLMRPMTLGVRAVAFDAQGRVLLVRHTYIPGWHLPGGGVEPGETAGEALAKELREEAGLEPVGAPEFLGVYFNDAHSRRDHVLVYVVRGVSPVAGARHDWEIAQTGFFAPDALPEGAARASRERIAEALGQRPLSARW